MIIEKDCEDGNPSWQVLFTKSGMPFESCELNTSASVNTSKPSHRHFRRLCRCCYLGVVESAGGRRARYWTEISFNYVLVAKACAHNCTSKICAYLGGGSWQRDDLLHSRPPATALANISSRWIPTNHREHLLSPSYVQATRCAIEPSFCFELWSYLPLVFFKAIWISLIAD